MPERATGVFVSISNHPVSGWGEAQLVAARRLVEGGELLHAPFPNVPPDAGADDLVALRDLVLAQLPAGTTAAMVAGEPVLAVLLVAALQRRGVRCFSATTRRDVLEDGDRKVSVFSFVQFRPYPRLAAAEASPEPACATRHRAR